MVRGERIHENWRRGEFANQLAQRRQHDIRRRRFSFQAGEGNNGRETIIEILTPFRPGGGQFKRFNQGRTVGVALLRGITQGLLQDHAVAAR